jgi:hypothetical protein
MGIEIAALRLIRPDPGFDATHTGETPPNCEAYFIGGIERWRSVLLRDPDPAAFPANLHIPARLALVSFQREGMRRIEAALSR